MWAIAGILVLACMCAVIEVPSLAAHKKDRWAFFVLLTFGTLLSIAVAVKLPVPNPLDWIAAVFQPSGSWMQSLFE